MDGPPAQSLGVEPVRGSIMRQPPRKATDAVISYHLIFRVVTSAALIVAGTLWVFRREVEVGLDKLGDGVSFQKSGALLMFVCINTVESARAFFSQRSSFLFSHVVALCELAGRASFLACVTFYRSGNRRH